MGAPTNLLGLQLLIQARLKQALAGQTPVVHVLTAAELAGVVEEKQLVPAVHVVYGGWRTKESRSDGKAARAEQTWLAVVAVRNVRGLAAGDDARLQAGELGLLVAQALMGWHAPGMATPLKIADGPGADFRPGFVYLPLAFTADLSLQAA